MLKPRLHGEYTLGLAVEGVDMLLPPVRHAAVAELLQVSPSRKALEDHADLHGVRWPRPDIVRRHAF